MMKLLLSLVLSFLALVAVARPNITLNAMDWSTISANASPFLPVATAKDLLVYYDLSAVDNTVQVELERGLPTPSGQPVMAVRRRNAEGVYVPVGNFTGFGSTSARTNGKWVAVFGMGVALFSVDENNTISEMSFIPAIISEGFLLSDDTFVCYLLNSPMDDGNYTINTYQYESSNNTWNEIAGTEVVINHELNSLSGITSYYVSDTHLVLMEPTNNLAVNIFERQANKSWNFVESVPVNNSAVGVNYNGVDTITCFAPFVQNGESAGALFVYTKINGKWTEQMFDAVGVGLRPVGLLGVQVSFVDDNTLLVSAPYDGASLDDVESLPTAGKIVMMTRNSAGLWDPSANLVGPGLFGLGIGVNDYDIVVPSISPFMNQLVSLTFQTLPRCFSQPINVTCANEQANDCADIEISSLYTINNAQCGAVETTFGQLGLANNAIRAQLSFSRAYGASVSCNVTVTCPSAPTFVQQQTPTGEVSSASTLSLGLLSLVSVLMAMST